MTELLTAAQMRAIEQAAIESGAVTGLELMERAGQGVVEAVFEEWPELSEGAHRAVVLCGPGNNGGDGFVVARLLHARGWDVQVFLYGDADKLPPDAKTNYERWREAGDVAPVSGLDDVSSRSPELVVDGLFGTGLTRPVEDLCDLFLDLNEETLRAHRFQFANCRLTSVDIPSGLCSDSGRVLGPSHWTEGAQWWRPTHLQSQLTVTFHRMKVGHMLAEGLHACGKVVVKDIGLER
ncbi:NAD(P)H-hydrate epimerase [uncultured Tateyamaria sp.]|uniref:NAD(P)H-hydrate epimerase n=1 Tax=uncultured Tateyamaria sp. TaxID=455651 RepID=UPI003428E75D